MGRRCCVPGCNSTSRLVEHHGVTYHSFPLDLSIRAIWLRNCRLSATKPITKSVLVCSRHFRRVDFQPQRNGKYLLKQRVFPTVFAWGKIDPEQVLKDQEQLKNAGIESPGADDLPPTDTNIEDATKASVEAKVAQIMAETAELNAAAGLKSVKSRESNEGGSPGVRYDSVTSFNPGARLEAQDFDGLWHSARIVEVDNEEREVLIKFERNGKNKSTLAGTEEWIPMNSTRLRQRVSTKPIAVFQLEEKCLARWSGPRKFPGTIKKILGNDVYEVLFDDGFVKNVRAVHMSKVADVNAATLQPAAVENTSGSIQNIASAQPLPPLDPARAQSVAVEKPDSSNKKRVTTGSRKDWPLLDLSKLNLESLNLPAIPRDGEWTCHWVNDQPIGREGYLLVGEHRKPTVIVEDWRLPAGWVKHMYQRSNVLGKWDVILVSPNGKRFRSKSDLKVFLEEQGQVYNPDIYDFSIHRRRAKDINAYVFTPDYQPQQPVKAKPMSVSFEMSTGGTSTLNDTLGLPPSSTNSSFMEAPIATPLPPMELMTPSASSPLPKSETPLIEGKAVSHFSPSLGKDTTFATGEEKDALPNLEPGFAYIGGLKVQIVDNLFRCPKEDCSKTFRKENHVQIHVKHYHPELKKLLGSCPKMMELAKKRTHSSSTDTPAEPHPKNQIPNQEFFSKLYQQDISQHSRRKPGVAHDDGTSLPGQSDILDDTKTPLTTVKPARQLTKDEIKLEPVSPKAADASIPVGLKSSPTAGGQVDFEKSAFTGLTPGTPSFQSRGTRRPFTARKSNRQRTSRRYLTAAQTTRRIRRAPMAHNSTIDSSFGVSDFEETRHSFNATPDPKAFGETRKRKLAGSAGAFLPLATQMSSDSPLTADSGSSSMHLLNESDANRMTYAQHHAQQQYIKENGEMIKIVRMRQEEIINCVCQFGEEDGLMIQCELCLCWQHGACHGIEKESDVPEKYVCYICRNPERGRASMRYKHDQDWLFEGVLPVANYHTKNPNLSKRFEILRRSHTLAGNLVETKNFVHSLRVKMNIASNRLHPKLYLWAKKWEPDSNDEKGHGDAADTKSSMGSLVKKAKIDSGETKPPTLPNIPQPEAPIDPAECQQRLLAHIKVQQDLVMERLLNIEAEVDDLEAHDDLPDLKDADAGVTKDVLVTFIKELELMHEIAKINQYENAFREVQEQTSNSLVN